MNVEMDCTPNGPILAMSAVSYVCNVVIVMRPGLSWNSKRRSILCNENKAGAIHDNRFVFGVIC